MNWLSSNIRFNRKRAAQFVVVFLSALALKQYYSTASVNQLRWILAPTTRIVEIVTSSRFEFESHAGYMSSDRSFVIAASCAGVNFLIAAFLMLTIRTLWSARNTSWRFIPAAALIAYLATLVANAARISTAIHLKRTPLEISWLNANQLHRLEGILIYFGFLLLLFLLSERIGWGEGGVTRKAAVRMGDATISLKADNPAGFLVLLRQSFFPLLIYYATTLGIPVVTAAYRSEPIPADLWEHFVFVLLTPLILILPLATFRLAHRLLNSETPIRGSSESGCHQFDN